MGVVTHLTLALAGFQASQALVTRQTPSNACSSLQLVIARGTDEPGVFGILGNKLFNETQALIPDVDGYPVNYPANLDCNSVPTGVEDTINHLNSQSAACPDQKFALVGYSQGADVIHKAGVLIPEALWEKVIAIAQFGDPANRGIGALDPLGGVISGTFPGPLANRVKENCAYNDLVCTNNGTSLMAHESYIMFGNTSYVANSVQFIVNQFKSGGNSGSDYSQAVSPGTETQGNIAALLALGKLLGKTITNTADTCTASATIMPVSPSSMGSGSNSSMPSNSTATTTMTGYSTPTATTTGPAMQTSNAAAGLAVNFAGVVALFGGALALM